MKQKKDIRITLRLTQEQYKSISEKADAAQMTIGHMSAPPSCGTRS